MRMAEVSKKRIWLKVSLWVVFTPVMLFVLLMALLYVPPVQDFIRRKATAMASEATGMQIGVERIDLRFPLNLLVRGVSVVQPADSTSLPVAPPDTLLALGSLNVHVQAWPLLRGQVEVDGIAVNNVAVNSAGLIDGMSLKGTLGSFFLQSHGIDLARETVVLNNVELADTHLQLALADTTTAPPDTTSTALAWKVRLHSLRLRNVSVGLDMPLDTLHLAARVGQADVDEAFADLGRQDYRLDKFLLTKTSVAYDAGVATPSASGFDPSHLLLRDVHVAVDSVRYCGRDMNAVIRELTLNEHSGLSVVSLTGQLDESSNYGPQSVDIAAPGTYVLSTIPGNRFDFLMGTSMAAPMVTGICAMVYSYRTDLDLAGVRNAVLGSARRLDSLNGLVTSGGIPDMYAAMSYGLSLQ